MNKIILAALAAAIYACGDIDLEPTDLNKKKS